MTRPTIEVPRPAPFLPTAMLLLLVAWGPAGAGAAPGATADATRASKDDETLAAATQIARAAPGTDIYLARLAGGPRPAAPPRNLTARPGYDNQPAFSPDGRYLYFSAIRDGRQADVYRIDLTAENAAPTQVTSTVESEFSPTPMPGGGLSAVRVEAGGAQRLWHIDAQDGSDVAVLTPAIDNVGYHAWLDADHLALMLVAEPTRLVVLDVDGATAGQTTPIAEGVGRALQRVPDEAAIAFVREGPDGAATIEVLHYPDAAIAALAPALGPGRDFALAPDGSLYMAAGRTLQRFDDKVERWRPIAVFEALPGEITRLAISPGGDFVALVVAEASADGGMRP